MHFHLIFRNDHIHASGCEQTNTVSSTDLVLIERITGSCCVYLYLFTLLLIYTDIKHFHHADPHPHRYPMITDELQPT